jgi:hypothetical protein
MRPRLPRARRPRLPGSIFSISLCRAIGEIMHSWRGDLCGVVNVQPNNRGLPSCLNARTRQSFVAAFDFARLGRTNDRASFASFWLPGRSRNRRSPISDRSLSSAFGPSVGTDVGLDYELPPSRQVGAGFQPSVADDVSTPDAPQCTRDPAPVRRFLTFAFSMGTFIVVGSSRQIFR